MAAINNKLALLLLGLFALSAVVVAQEPEQEKEEQPALDNEDFEDVDDADEELSGAPTEFGLHDVIDEGVPRLVKPRGSECINMRKEQACKQCCSDKGKSYKYEFDPSIKRVRQFSCTCFQRRVGN